MPGRLEGISLRYHCSSTSGLLLSATHFGTTKLAAPCSAAEGNACHLGKQIAMTEELAVEVIDGSQAVNIPSHEGMRRLRKHLEPSHRSNAAGSEYLRVSAFYSTGCAAFCCGACAGRMEWCHLGAVVLTAGLDYEDTQGKVAHGLLPMPQLTHDRLCWRKSCKKPNMGKLKHVWHALN